MRQIFIFDLDGVLIQPRGYRRAIDATMCHFTSSWGLGDMTPGEDIIALFEAFGITSEWDIVPICLACVLETILSVDGAVNLSDHPDIGMNLASSAGNNPEVHYHSYIKQIDSLKEDGLVAGAERLIEIGLHDPAHSPFPNLVKQPMYNRLFAGSRSVYLNPVTRLFQNYVLGSLSFSQTYHLSPQVETPSFLQIYDQPLLGDRENKLLRRFWESRQLDLTVMTARPSLAPAKQGMLPGFTPEAELALDLLSFQDVPLVGYGSLGWIAAHHGVSPDTLIKPAPYQALAAILASDRREIDAALRKAMMINLGKDSTWSRSNPVLDEMTLHIFEDSPIGIQAVQSAANLLTCFGFILHVRSWGIASQRDKVAALMGVGATVLDSVNAAIPAALIAAGIEF